MAMCVVFVMREYIGDIVKADVGGDASSGAGGKHPCRIGKGNILAGLRLVGGVNQSRYAARFNSQFDPHLFLCVISK